MNAKRLIFFLLLSALALGGVLLGVAFYLFRPLKAEAIVQDYLKAPGLSLKEAPYGVELFPQSPKALLAFYPGARVEPLAYAPVLAPVAEAGYLVVLLKVPSGIALLGKERALEAHRAHSGLPWVGGGHSLGGVAAAELAASEGLPLILFASYPEKDLSQENLPVLALFGTEDGLLPPEKAREKARLLPKNARVVFVEGLNHAGFGAYGPQKGDRPARRPREALWREIQEEVLLFLGGLGLDAPPPPQAHR
ncbi:alpha/beta hydrolase [Thermus scotoductus]|uniref:Alpha/beta hydrolase n=1 Tax=Thermus scotoductus TaxID=37636 RepID=A0A430S4Q7_THESC|nr:alpha/beta hydrolase [Thermus scotoductus]RTG93368.1 alpha/beta hydrolase [Thermus scotoductus]RTH08905.1 alpha/beta hydrolase [Thermus scotoductus]RTH13154.1 alpha/beta hydrolase [Thermus scotoductus]RTH14985.1 alpha/beta hydrolase [Thermus scotoductus]RTH15458.1 alpha/beta hydrolase [Thermus scotoductus]